MKKNKKILITGATGFLGFNLAQFLIQKDYEIFGIGRNSSKGKELQNMGVNFIYADIESDLRFENLNFDYIVHCAALSSPHGTYEEHYKTNVIGTKNVINLAKKLGSSLIHISSPSIYFSNENKFSIKEEDRLPKKFASFYSQTKYEAEKLVIKANQENGLKTVILRPRGIFGEYDQSIIPKILKISRFGAFPLINNGNSIIDITYVKNVCHSIELCINKIDEINGEIFNITNDSPESLKNILDLLFSKLEKKIYYLKIPHFLMNSLALTNQKISEKTNYFFKPNITPYTLGLISYSQTLNIEKAKNKLGYKPIFSIEEGIENFILWNQKNEN